MKLLQKEFFGKIYKFIKEIKIMPIRIIAKLLFYLIILVIMGVLIWMIVTKKYVWLIVVIGIAVLGEVAHFIRKSREKVMNKRIEDENDMDDEAKASLNKGGLVNESSKKKVIKKKITNVLNKDGLLSKK